MLDSPWLTVGDEGEMALVVASEVKVLKPAPMPLINVDGLALVVVEAAEATSSRLPLLLAISERFAV